LNYYVRYFSSASGNPAACVLLFVNSVCWRTYGGFSLIFLIIQIKSTTNVVSVATCNMLIIISCKLHRLCPLCRRSLFCTAVMQVFSPVSLVFALHMIKIWNRKNWNRTVNDRNRPQIHKWKPSQHYLLRLKHNNARLPYRHRSNNVSGYRCHPRSVVAYSTKVAHRAVPIIYVHTTFLVIARVRNWWMLCDIVVACSTFLVSY